MWLYESMLAKRLLPGKDFVLDQPSCGTSSVVIPKPVRIEEKDELGVSTCGLLGFFEPFLSKSAFVGDGIFVRLLVGWGRGDG